MSKTLHDLQEQYKLLIHLSESDEGDFSKALEQTEGDITKKLESYAIVDLELEAEENKFDAEIKRLKERKDKISKNRKNLRERMKETLYLVEGNKVKTNLFSIGLRKSTAVQIEDESLIPPQFIKTETKVVKTDLAKLLKEGAEIPGARLVQNQSLSIK